MTEAHERHESNQPDDAEAWSAAVERQKAAERRISSVIERGFRFIEMLIVTALVGFAIGAIYPRARDTATLFLSTAAAAYLIVPAYAFLKRVAAERERAEQKSRRRELIRVFGSLLVMALAFPVFVAALQLQDVLSATVQLDPAALRRSYEHIRAEKAAEACRTTAGRTGRPLSRCPPYPAPATRSK